jgi:hypothetical protein
VSWAVRCDDRKNIGGFQLVYCDYFSTTWILHYISSGFICRTQIDRIMAEKPEAAPLISSSQAQVAAAAGASAINAASSKIKKATQDGPLTFRIMGFIGGLGMIVSNGLGIVDRFMSFNFTGSLTAIYGCLFGIMSTSGRMDGNVAVTG